MKRFLALLLCFLMVTPVFAVGGTADDPAVTRSYLTQVWEPQFLQKQKNAVAAAVMPRYAAAFRRAAETMALQRQKAESSVTRRTYGKLLLKQGDTVLPAIGCKLLLLDGSAAGGADLIDVTRGAPAPSTLLIGTLYMQGAGAAGNVRILSDTAEFWVDGTYTLHSAVGADCGSLAAALNKMGLFRGMADGYILQGGATRAQGLVMFLRLMGLEQDALQCQKSVPFTDVTGHWAKPYIAYAYSQGLTAGTSATRFSPDEPVTAQHYMTFLLRALQYTENTDFTYKTVLKDCVDRGLFGQKEIASLQQKPFTRGWMAYLSYYALFCPNGAKTQLLLDRLVDSGVLTVASAAAGLKLARGGRLG